MDYKLIEKQGRTRGDELYFLCIPNSADGVDLTAYYMQTSRDLPWLIPMRYVSYDGKNTFCYDLEGQYRLDVERILHSREELIETLIGICEVVIEAERHLIDPMQLIWNWQCVFQGENSPRFIAVPVPVTGSPEKQLYLHFRELLDMAGADVRDTLWFERLQGYFAATDRIDVREFRRFLYQLRVNCAAEHVRMGQTMVLTEGMNQVRVTCDEEEQVKPEGRRKWLMKALKKG